MKKIPDSIADFFARYGTYIIASHREPDGDCIGSSLALASFLLRQGKKTVLLSAGPFKRPEIREFEPLFVKSVAGLELPGDTAVAIVDCSGMDRLGDASKGIETFPAVILDHHATNSADTPGSFVDSSAPSTTVIIQSLIEMIDGPVTKEEAEHLLFGLCTDTGFFRHLDTRSSETFALTARLVSAGANPKKTFAHMNGGKSFGSRILISRILARMTPYYDKKLIVSWETLEDTLEFGQEGRDSDTLYQLVQSISGVEAIVILRQETEKNCTIGFRSLDRVDVSIVAARFGGGGHRQASGLSMEGHIEDIMPLLIAAFADQFPGLEA